MKHSEINSTQNNFGIQIGPLDINKPFSLSEQGITVSNSNSNQLMINSVIPTHININSGTLLNTTLNKSVNLTDGKNINVAFVTKPTNSLNAPLNSSLVSPIQFPANAIKLVNITKMSKDNNNPVPNNTINVQIVSNTSNAGCNESSISLQPNCKVDSITLNSSMLTTSTINPTVSATSGSLAGTRLVIQGASPQFLHHGTLTIFPQTPDMTNNSITNNNLIKNPKYLLTGNKPQHQTIRPISTGSVSSVASQNNINKQSISIISPSKNVSNQTVIQDLSNNRSQSVQNDAQRCPKSAPLKIPLQSYSVSTNSNNNIRLALTSTINNSRGNTNQSKIQLISPKSRKRSGSPLSLLQDGKIRNQSVGSKDENLDNSVNYNNSPTRKRSRKQHLKAVSTKSQKPIVNQKVLLHSKTDPANHLNNIRPALNEKSMPTAVVVSTNISKSSNISFPNKSEDISSTISSTPINTQIFIKNTIQRCPSKPLPANQSLTHRPTTIYTSNTCNNSNSNSNTPTSVVATTIATINCSNNANISSNNAIITPNHQFQIISQNQNIKQIQLPTNIILSPKLKCQTPFSPSKVIHIAPSISTINRATFVKNENLISEPPVSTSVSVDKAITTTAAIASTPTTTTTTTSSITTTATAAVITKDKKEKSVESIKVEISDIKSETSEDLNLKISLFPIKYNWNPRRNHFLKKSDVKFKKSKSTPITKFPNNLSSSENQDDENVTDVEMDDINWLLYKSFSQICMQKSFDEENLQNIYKMKEKFHIHPQVDELSQPVFRKICSQTQFYDPIPDQIDTKCLSKFTDPHLFGISEDIIESYVNSLTHNDSEFSELSFPNTQPHECSAECSFYSLEVPPSNQPQKFTKIIDLIEGLIVKEKNIIEKETEINNHFLKCLRHTSDFTSEQKKSSSKPINFNDRVKLLSGYRR